MAMGTREMTETQMATGTREMTETQTVIRVRAGIGVEAALAR